VKEKAKRKLLWFFQCVTTHPEDWTGGTGLANLIQNEMEIWIKTVPKFRYFLLQPLFRSH